jgi:hypothetical protein
MQLEIESSTLFPIFMEDQVMRDKLQQYEPLWFPRI